MRKKIFWRFFLMTLCAVLLVFGSGLWAIHRNNEKIMEERLGLESDLLLYLLKNEDDVAKLESYVNKEDFRITVLKEDGSVLYESSILGDVLEENHSDREEIRAALSGAPQAVERYSDTFGCNMTYYACASTFDTGEVYVLRLAVRSDSIASYLGVMLPFLLLIFLITLLLAGFIASKMSEQISDKVQSVGAGLRSLNEGHYAPIQTDSGDAEFYTVFREINELAEITHQHLRTLNEEQDKLKTVLDNISQGIVAVDAYQRIVFANPAVCTLFGTSNHHVGDPLLFLIEDIGLYEKISTNVPSDTDFEYKLGETDLLVAIRHIATDEPCAVAGIIILTDITKEKNIAKEKSDFFANASHELKTPITVMQGLTELMLTRDQLDEASRKQVARIHKESLRMADLISDMLKLSQLERREEDIPTVPIDLRRVADEVVAELAPSIQAKGLSVSIRGEGTVTADPKRLYELMSNLCSNAINYNNDNGRVDILVTAEDRQTVLTVSDTGIGIAKEHLPRLCERFYRVDKSRSKKTGGTGLGLAIVKHICALYHAEMKIESELGRGTRVTVTFPNP